MPDIEHWPDIRPDTEYPALEISRISSIRPNPIQYLIDDRFADIIGNKQSHEMTFSENKILMDIGYNDRGKFVVNLAS